MNPYMHTIISALSLYFAYKIGRTMQKKSLVEEIANQTLNKLERIGAIKYAIKNDEKVFKLFKNMKED